MPAARERRVSKRYSDEVLLRKKTRTKPTTVKLYPVVVTAVNEVAKRVKIHYVGIFGSLFVILAASLCAVELFLKFLWLGNFMLQRFFYRSFLTS